MSTDPLALPPEEMRRLGYRAVDLLIDRLLDVDAPPVRRHTPAAMRALLDEPPPERPAAEPLDRLFRDVLAHAARVDHPRYLAFIPCSGTWPGALGDFAASALSLYAGSWAESPGPTQLELTVLGWFKAWLGYPAGADGQLTSGGSQANLQALACARELRAGAMRDDLVVYVSDQGHSSLARSARVLGFRPEQVRVLPTDGEFRLRPETLATAIDSDRARGLTPLFASASAGATNTGAVDPLAELAQTCRERAVWLHVDAAYGGFAVLTDRGRAALAGIELADSVTLDPHKWLYQPYECGCVLVREQGALRAAFQVVPPYLKDVDAGDGEVNLGDHGIQLSRTSRALKVWLSVQTFGLRAFREAIDRSLDHAEHAARRIEASESLELLAPPSLGIVCCRRRFQGVDDERELARLNGRLAAGLEESGTGFVSSTVLGGRYAIRLCPLNHATERRDVDGVLDQLEREPPVLSELAAQSHKRDGDVRRSWLRAPVGAGGVDATPELVAALPWFGQLTPRQLERVARLGAVREVAAGETILREWDASRDFYVVLEGDVTVSRTGELLDTVGPGEFFGEIAALDWGRGYGYPRIATIAAAGPVRLLAFGDGALEALMSLSPSLAEEVERVVAARLRALA
ncbi:MAG TPA: aminotransferase class I/II-fold pyridoxal phosphate-dependent enzyme [Gaiellaceae bacterium]|nr:aminotransferase class I/II-fold pyridoxal phosphate-dependent enzyme [Gaiellaceae bacterium]